MKKFVIDTVILTGTSFFLQFSWLAFNIYISQKSGAASLGLYQLIMSVYRFAVTLAVSGIGLTATKLAAHETAHKNANLRAVMRSCCIYALFFGLLAQLLMIFSAEATGNVILKDARTVTSLKIIGISLPFISLSSCMGGYFTATGKAYKYAVAQVFEQVVRIVSAWILIAFVFDVGAENTCIAITLGGCIGEILSFVLSAALYLPDAGKGGRKIGGIGIKTVKTSVPLAVSSYLRSGISTVSHIMIPAGLSKYGESRENSLKKYGEIHGMAMPVIMFASAFLYSAASLIVPELSRYLASGEREKIDKSVSKNFRFTMLFSVFVSVFMLVFGDSISLTVYKNAELSIYIKLLAPLAAVMYLDSSVDGMLKGLDEQVRSMQYNIIDSAVSLVLICLLIPKTGIAGYIFVIFVSELLNAYLSISRLIKITDFKVDFVSNVILPVMCAGISALTAKIILPGRAGYGGLVIALSVCAMFYVSLIWLTAPKASRADK